MITPERKKEIEAMAEGDWLDDYRIGQVKLLDIDEVEIYGLNDEELKVYINTYNSYVSE